MNEEEETALSIAARARADLLQAQKAYRRAMGKLYFLAIPNEIIAHRLHMRYDTVRMDRRRHNAARRRR